MTATAGQATTELDHPGIQGLPPPGRAVKTRRVSGKNIVYFDLETQRSFGDVGGFRPQGKMGVSVAVTYSTARGTYEIYPENEMEKLGEELVRADLVVGWNHMQFDYPVLQPYVFHTLAEQTINLDMMLDLETQARFPPQARLRGIRLTRHRQNRRRPRRLRWWQEHKKTGEFRTAAQNRRILRLRRQGHQMRARIRARARVAQIRRQERTVHLT
jgi:hypothetical protein